MKNVAVFFGGQSVEHDVSVITGTLTVNSLDAQKYNGVPVYVSQEGKWYTGESLKDIDGYKNLKLNKLKQVTFVGGSNVLSTVKGNKIKPLCEVAVAVNCMHGERGEDGSLAGLLNMCGVPLANPSTYASSTAISKTNTKLLLKGLHVKTLPYVTVESVKDLHIVTKSLDFPLFVKPDCGGSSIGVGKAENKAQLLEAVLNALRYGDKVIIEPYVQNCVEINCACYSYKGKLYPSLCEKPVGAKQFLSFDDKYCDGQREFPADIPQELSERIRNITQRVYSALNASGVIRIDYMLIDGQIYLNEINTVPGSLAYYLFTDTLKGFSELLTKWISVAQESFSKSQTHVKCFNSSILNGISGSKGAKRLKKT